ncbi:hypothetical protein M4R22_04285 [Acidovorax sp. GBBC 3334]|nr:MULTISPECIES: hypothetical protein [unclassified Acidovorax]MDA8453975.1 hypothetical protein [Acidovorax sp. GBBC 3334]MDA8519351.1 hypothetical protein [Acidovorax sp. NCPPB 4044]
MNTMNRCQPHTHLFRSRRLRSAAALLLALGAAAASVPAAAQQVQPSLGGVRNFPDAALRGTLVVLSTAEAQINGNTVRMAPGMRIFSPQNSLVMAHTVIGQSFTVNYVIEPSTGMLHAAWILSKAEAAQPRKGSGGSSLFDTLFGSGS